MYFCPENLKINMMKKITLLLFLAVGSFASAQSLDTLKLDTTNEQRLEDLKAKAKAQRKTTKRS